jgi:hypothetical protein
MKNNQQNINAFLVHIPALTGFIFPFGHIIIPLIAWQTLKDRSSFLNAHGKEAVNFNLSYTLYTFILTLSFILFVFGSFLRNLHNLDHFPEILNFNTNIIFGFIGFGTLTGLVYLVGIALIIKAALKAKEGKNYSYPFTIKFIK